MRGMANLLATRDPVRIEPRLRLIRVPSGSHWAQNNSNLTVQLESKLSMLAATTSGREKELVKQGILDKTGMVTFGLMRERFGKAAGVAKLFDVFQFPWTSNEGLEHRWLKWVKLMRHVGMTSLGDDARETLLAAGFEKGTDRDLEQHWRLRAPQSWIALSASVDQYFRTTVGSSANQPHAHRHQRCGVDVWLLWPKRPSEVDVSHAQ